MTLAGIYARISRDDEHTELGVTRQIADCQQEAERRGWDVVQVYSDNDVSANGQKPREEFDRMFAAAKAGRINALVCWDADRLSRSPKENEQIIDLADATGLQLANVGGEIDLSSPQGRMTFRIKGAVARHEIEQSSRRIRRKFDERAAGGLPHGMTAYGYRRVVEYDEHGQRAGSRDEIDTGQARVIRDVADRLLAGESLRSLARDMSERGDLSPRGTPWSSTTLRQVMLRDRNAGLRRHRGAVVGKAAWEPILSEDKHMAVVALLTDPDRRQSRGSARRHLLTGLLVCGNCGEDNFRVIAEHTRQDGKHQAPRYQCGSCFKVSRMQTVVDEYVEAVVVARLSRPDALAALTGGQPNRTKQLRADVEGLEARLSLAADQFADGAITADQLRRITAKIRGHVDSAKAEIAACSPSPALDMAGSEAAVRWDHAPLDVRRAIIDALLTVTITGVGRGNGRSTAVEDSVVIEWKGARL
jgi:site-specific DNA recombinase